MDVWVTLFGIVTTAATKWHSSTTCPRDNIQTLHEHISDNQSKVGARQRRASACWQEWEEDIWKQGVCVSVSDCGVKVHAFVNQFWVPGRNLGRPRPTCGYQIQIVVNCESRTALVLSSLKSLSGLHGVESGTVTSPGWKLLQVQFHFTYKSWDCRQVGNRGNQPEAILFMWRMSLSTDGTSHTHVHVR